MLEPVAETKEKTKSIFKSCKDREREMERESKRERKQEIERDGERELLLESIYVNKNSNCNIEYNRMPSPIPNFNINHII